MVRTKSNVSRKGGKARRRPQHVAHTVSRRSPASPRKGPFPIHALARAVPAMGPAEYADLKADIKAHGLLDPITLYQGRVLDGANRQRACHELHLTPQYTDWRPGANGATPASYVRSRNLCRRHITAGQRAAWALALAKDMRLQFHSGRKKGGGDVRRIADYLGVKLPPGTKGKFDAIDLAASAVGASPMSTEVYRVLTHETPALAQQVRAGTLDLYAADKQRRQRQPKPTPSRQAQTTTQRKMILHFSQAEYERADIDLRRVQTTMKLATPEATLLYLLREWHEPPAEAAS